MSRPPPTALPLPAVLVDALEEEEESGDDNWDSDFEEGISSSKLAALDREGGSSNDEDDGAGSDDDDFQDANSHTIRPSHSSAASTTSLPVPMVPIVEDYSDLVGDDEADPFAGRVASLRVSLSGRNLLYDANNSHHQQYNTQKKRILHPKDISASFLTESPTSTINILSNRDQPSSSSSRPSYVPPLAAAAPLALSARFTPHHRASSSGKSSIEQYTELESEDYSDVFGKSAADQLCETSISTLDLEADFRCCAASNLEALQLNTKLSSKSWVSSSELAGSDLGMTYCSASSVMRTATRKTRSQRSKRTTSTRRTSRRTLRATSSPGSRRTSPSSSIRSHPIRTSTHCGKPRSSWCVLSCWGACSAEFLRR